MVKCCVPFCSTKGSRLFHSFPADKDIRKQWVEKTRNFHLTEEEMENYGKVCKLHFKSTDFELNPRGQVGLKKNTIPSLNLPPLITHQQEHNYSNLGADNSNVLFPQGKRRKRRATEAFSELSKLSIDNKVYFEYDVHEAEVVTESVTVNIDADELNQLKAENFSMSKKLLANGKKFKEMRQQMRQQMQQQKLNNKNSVMNFLSQLFNPQQLAFFAMQLTNSGKKSRGRRYASEEKSLSLTLYKHSPKNYRFMRTIFILPDKRTLGRHSAQLIFETGIDKNLFEHIKTQVSSIPELETYCSLSWDEVSLTAHLDYSKSRDIIDGFVELEKERKPSFATHALTFMVRGIHVPFKQPIGYFYTDALKAIELKELILLMTEEVLKTGLKVILSTCDQVRVNVKAVDLLINPDYLGKPIKPTGGLLMYKIGNSTIIHCFDPPHLIKGIRNNLYTKKLTHYVTKRWDTSELDLSKYLHQKSPLIASWDDVRDLYKYNLRGSTKLLPKITDEHIDPNKLKMKVSVATQVFSETYGTVMLQCCKNRILPRISSDTAQVLLFFNDLFDSVNGSSFSVNNKLKSPVTNNSVHFSYWQYALHMLSKMYFHDNQTGKPTSRTSVIQNFQSTIRGYIELSKKCFDLNISEISLRNTNQDGLENFFGCVKDCSHNSNTLIATQYKSGYATMYVNNLTSSHSIKANCERDFSKPLLKDAHELFSNYKRNIDDKNNCDINNGPNETNCILNDISEHDEIEPMIIFDPQFSEMETSSVNNEALQNISSLVCQKLVQAIKCEPCIATLETSSIFIDSNKENTLKYPSSRFILNFKNIMCRINDVLPHICAEKCVKKRLLDCIVEGIQTENMGCSKHYDEVKLKFMEHCATYGILTFCKNINNLLSGKNTTLPPDFSFMEEHAYIFRKKKKRIGKHSDIFKC